MLLEIHYLTWKVGYWFMDRIRVRGQVWGYGQFQTLGLGVVSSFFLAEVVDIQERQTWILAVDPFFSLCSVGKLQNQNCS